MRTTTISIRTAAITAQGPPRQQRASVGQHTTLHPYCTAHSLQRWISGSTPPPSSSSSSSHHHHHHHHHSYYCYCHHRHHRYHSSSSSSSSYNDVVVVVDDDDDAISPRRTFHSTARSSASVNANLLRRKGGATSTRGGAHASGKDGALGHRHHHHHRHRRHPQQQQQQQQHRLPDTHSSRPHAPFDGSQSEAHREDNASGDYTAKLFRALEEGNVARAERVLQTLRDLKLQGHPRVAQERISTRAFAAMLGRYGELRQVHKAEGLLRSLQEPPFSVEVDVHLLNGMVACYGSAGDMDRMFGTYELGIKGAGQAGDSHATAATFSLLIRGLLSKVKFSMGLHRGSLAPKMDRRQYQQRLAMLVQELRRAPCRVRLGIHAYNRLLEIAAKLDDIPMMTAIFDELVAGGAGGGDGGVTVNSRPPPQRNETAAAAAADANDDQQDRVSCDAAAAAAAAAPLPAPDVYTFTIAIKSLCQRGDNAKAEHYLRLMTQVYGIRPNKFTWQPIIDFYCKHGQPQRALELFRTMTQELQPDCHFFTSLISGFSHVGDTKMALHVFHMARDSYNIPLNEVLYTTVVNMFVSLNDIENAHKYFDEMLQCSLRPNTYTVSTLVNLYTRNGMNDEVMELLKRMQAHRVTVANTTYEAVMGYMATEKRHDMLEVLLDMMIEGYEMFASQQAAVGAMHSSVQPRIWTFNLLMRSFLQADMPSRTIDIYNRLLRHRHQFAANLDPDRSTYRTVLLAHSRIGDKQEVLQLYREHMADKPFYPDSIVLQELVDCCVSADHFDAIVDLFAFLSHPFLHQQGKAYNHRKMPEGYKRRHVVTEKQLNQMRLFCQSLLDGGSEKYSIPREKVESLMADISSLMGIRLQSQKLYMSNTKG